MFRVLIVVSIVLTAGCSAYDVTRKTADSLWSSVFSNEDNDTINDEQENKHVFWDEDVSRCIPVEKRERRLDQFFDSIEEGREYVVLPTGERYPVNQDEYPDDDSLQTPTAACIERHSD